MDFNHQIKMIHKSDNDDYFTQTKVWFFFIALRSGLFSDT